MNTYIINSSLYKKHVKELNESKVGNCAKRVTPNKFNTSPGKRLHLSSLKHIKVLIKSIVPVDILHFFGNFSLICLLGKCKNNFGTLNIITKCTNNVLHFAKDANLPL